MRISLKKVSDLMIIPEDQNSAEFISNLKTGQVITAEFKKPRNYRFHKKYFALLNFAYENWEPLEFQDSKWQGITPEKSFERFRKDLIILSGHYEAVYRVDGSIRIEPKSIAFANMDEEQFNELYDATINVILKKILKNYTKQDLQNVLNELESFY